MDGVIITMSSDQLKQMMIETCREAIRAERKLKEPALEENQITKEEAMALAGYKSDAYFREFCKRNRIQPVATRAKKHYYFPSQITKVSLKKTR